MATNLKSLGREWAALAIRHGTEPTTTGNLEHDNACAQFFLRHKGAPPSWYTIERFGPIYTDYDIHNPWKPNK